MSKRPGWRVLLALFCSIALALAPALAEARAGSSAGGRGSSFGSRGMRSWDNNGAQPLSRSAVPHPDAPRRPGMSQGTPAAAYGGSFFQRHPFLTGLAGGMIGSWLFGRSGLAADGTSGGSAFGILLELALIGLLIYLAIRLFRRRSVSGAWPGAGSGFGFPPRSAGAAASPQRLDRGRDVDLADADLTAFQTIHAAVQEAWSDGDLAALRRLMTTEMLGYFSDELTRNASRGVGNLVSDVRLVKGELTESWQEGDLQYATALMSWRAIDYLVRLGRAPSDPDYVAGGDPREPSEAEEMWTFVRSRSGGWLLSAIQQV